MSAPFALLGFPSVQSIVEGIVEFFFQDLARALVPDFLKKASVATIKWLVALPDPTGWPHVGQLEGDMAVLAASVLAVSFTAAVVRYLAVGVTGSGSPLAPLSSTVSSAAMLVGYRWGAHEAVAGVNALTGSILSFPVVGAGLQRTVGVLFGGALLVGSGSLFFAILVIVAVVFAAVMFAVKVLLLVGVGLVYVTGLLVIALRPLGEGASMARMWLSLVMTIALVPIGWTIVFALAGALALDATSLSAGAGGGLSGHLMASLAAVLTFYLAVKLPIGALSHLRASLVGMASGARAGGGAGGGGEGGGGGGVGRVADAHARLRSGGLAAGRSLGSAAGALGAPAGGAVGLAGRAVGGLAGPVGFGLAAAGGVFGGRGSGSSGGPGLGGAAGLAGGGVGAGGREAEGRQDGGRGEASGVKGRIARAGGILAQTPAQVRDAARGDAGRSSGPGGGGGVGGGSAGAGTERRDDGASKGAGSGVAEASARLGSAGAAGAGGSALVGPPRPPQRGTPAGEGSMRVSSASGRSGSFESNGVSRSLGEDNGKRAGRVGAAGMAPQVPAAPGGGRGSAEARARREGTRSPVRKPRGDGGGSAKAAREKVLGQKTAQPRGRQTDRQRPRRSWFWRSLGRD